MKKAPSETFDYTETQKRVFFENKQKEVFIGGAKVTPQLRDLLREQAKYLMTSQLWEILHASTDNEAISLALIQSLDFDAVRFAKAMRHWSIFTRTIVMKLAAD